MERLNLNAGQDHGWDIASPEVEAFLTHLAVERKVSASTQNQAMSAILFLYKEVLGRELDWLENVERARRPGGSQQRTPLKERSEITSAVAIIEQYSNIVGERFAATGYIARASRRP